MKWNLKQGKIEQVMPVITENSDLDGNPSHDFLEIMDFQKQEKSLQDFKLSRQPIKKEESIDEKDESDDY